KAKSAAYGEPGTGEAGARVAAYKLEIDALKWILSKEYARDYGDKVTQELTGAEGAPLIPEQRKDRSRQEMEEFAAMLAAADRKARPNLADDDDNESDTAT